MATTSTKKSTRGTKKRSTRKASPKGAVGTASKLVKKGAKLLARVTGVKSAPKRRSASKRTGARKAR